MSRRIAAQSAASVFVLPALLALVSLAGLLLGLTGDGWRDAAAAVLLLVPVVVFVRHWLQRG